MWLSRARPVWPPITTATMRRLPSLTDETRLKPEARV